MDGIIDTVESPNLEKTLEDRGLSSDKELMRACITMLTPDTAVLSEEAREAMSRCYELTTTLMEISEIMSREAHSPLEEGEECSSEDNVRLEKLDRKVDLMFSILIDLLRRIVIGAIEAKKKSCKERKKMNDLDSERQRLEYHRDYLKQLIAEFDQRENDYKKIELSLQSDLSEKCTETDLERHALIKQRLNDGLRNIRFNMEKAQYLSKKKSQILLEKRVQLVELGKIKKELDSVHKSILSLKETIKLKQDPGLDMNTLVDNLPYPLFTLYTSLLGCRADLGFSIDVLIISEAEMGGLTESNNLGIIASQVNDHPANHAEHEPPTPSIQRTEATTPEVNAHTGLFGNNGDPRTNTPYKKHPLKLKLLLGPPDGGVVLSFIVSFLEKLDTVVLESPLSKNLRCISPYSVPAGIFPHDTGLTHPNPNAASIIASSGMGTNDLVTEAICAPFHWLQRVCGLAYKAHALVKVPSVCLKYSNIEPATSSDGCELAYHSLVSVLKMLHKRHIFLSEIQEWIDNLERKVNGADSYNDSFAALGMNVPNVPSSLAFKISQSYIQDGKHDLKSGQTSSFTLHSTSPHFQCSVLVSIPYNFPDYPPYLSLLDGSLLDQTILEALEHFIDIENKATLEEQHREVESSNILAAKLSMLVTTIINTQSSLMQVVEDQLL